MITVRAPTGPEEFAAMAEKGAGFWYEAPFKSIPYDVASMCRTFHDMHTQGLLLVAYDDAKVVGGIGGVCGPAFFNDSYIVGSERFWWLDPAYRASRAGLLLLRGIEDAARARGCHYWSMLALEHSDPERAEFIYVRMGYERAERMYTKRL